MANWVEVRAPVTQEIEEALVNFLFELGSCGCQQLRQEVVAYFSDDVSKSEIQTKIAAYLHQLKSLGLKVPDEKCEVIELRNRDWNAEWKKHFKPIAVSDKFVVKPTWERIKKPTKAFVIEIDPKQAFGTGSHATTRLMLQFLEKYLTKGDKVLDIGTGTGILVIAAVKLGAKHVVALDHDPVAIEAARENIVINSTGANVNLLVGEPDSLSMQYSGFDVVLANLTKNIIFKFFGNFLDVLTQSGYLLLSGIMANELDEVKSRLSSYEGVRIVEECIEKDWLGLALTKEVVHEKNCRH